MFQLVHQLWLHVRFRFINCGYMFQLVHVSTCFNVAKDWHCFRFMLRTMMHKSSACRRRLPLAACRFPDSDPASPPVMPIAACRLLLAACCRRLLLAACRMPLAACHRYGRTLVVYGLPANSSPTGCRRALTLALASNGCACGHAPCTRFRGIDAFAEEDLRIR